MQILNLVAKVKKKIHSGNALKDGCSYKILEKKNTEREQDIKFEIILYHDIICQVQ